MSGDVQEMIEHRKVDLSLFDNSKTFDRGAGWIKLTLWYFTNALFFINPCFPFRRVKPWLLRLFGAKVGKGVVIHPGVNIKFPWKLSIGDHSWIGQRAWLDNLDRLTIGNHVVISQGAMIIQGSHDYKKIDYPTFTKPVVLQKSIGDLKGLVKRFYCLLPYCLLPTGPSPTETAVPLIFRRNVLLPRDHIHR